jgi:hypothetical protein
MRSACVRERFALALAVLAGAAALLSSMRASALTPEVEALQKELAATKQELDATRSALDALAKRVDALEPTGPIAPGPTAGAATPAPEPTVVASVPPAGATARLAPVNADNPAISFVVDTAFAQDVASSWQSIGYPDGSDFSLKNGELFISAPIDPFLRGYASINGTSDEGFDIEEAALVTTALPWNFTVKGGRFFADVGRLPHWHDEALPFVDRPPSIDRLIGGESGSEGVEVSWLAPIDHFVELTGGVYDAVGAESLEDQNENGFFGRRDFDELNVLARAHTYFDLTETLNVELGGSWVGVPRDTARNLYGTDVTVRHQPGTSGAYQGFAWGTEWLWNDQRFQDRDDDGVVLATHREDRQGGYTYVEGFFGRRFSGGLRFDYSEDPGSDANAAKTGSAFVTWSPSEFQRLRFQFDNTWGDDEETNQRFTLQWTAFIGSHSHGFSQR